MKSPVKTIFRWIFFWFLLPLVLFYSVIWIFHPEDKLMLRLNTALETQAGIRIDYAGITISPLGAITIKSITVEQVHDQKHNIDGQEFVVKKRRYFTGDELTIKVAWRQLFYRKAALHLTGLAYGGNFEGDLKVIMQKEVAPFDISGKWNGIRLEDLADDYPKLYIRKGLCSGTIDFLMDQTRVFKYKGPATLIIEDTEIQALAKADQSFDLPAFTKITGSFNFNYDELKIMETWCYASDMTVKISGTIYQRLPVKNSWLDLSLNLYLTGDSDNLKKDQYLPLKIKGPAKDPSIDFLGSNLADLQKSIR